MKDAGKVDVEAGVAGTGGIFGIDQTVRQLLGQSQQQNQQQQGDCKAAAAGASRWLHFCQQPKYVTLVALVLSLILVISSLTLSEDNHMSSFVDKVAASFRAPTQSEGLLQQKAENLKVQSPTESIPPRSAPENCQSNATEKEKASMRSPYYAQVAEALPHDIIVPTTDLQMRSLFHEDEAKVQKAMKKNLLAMGVGIKQKAVVNEMVSKFPLSNFTIMLFHYDGNVNDWQDLPWVNQSIHIAVMHQTKWWYAKRFMHPDIVDQYNYIFLWDEDFGVKHFDASRYLEIVESEGLEISQPGLDKEESTEIHHRITVRIPEVKLHRSIVSHECPEGSGAWPCTGWVEVMAPVFSKAAWRCVWHMVQNDLVHGWGYDFKIGYCAQGMRNLKVGVIDAEYIAHQSAKSLGGSQDSHVSDPRQEIVNKSYQELSAFRKRWAEAVKNDPTWVNPYEAWAAVEKQFGWR